MAKGKQKVQVYTKGDLLCEPLIDKLSDPTSTDGSAVLIFPDFNIFVMPNELFRTKSGDHNCQERLRPGYYVWVDWTRFQTRGDACLHWNDQLERLPLVDEELEPPPIAG